MGKALRKYWPLVAFVLVSSGLAIVIYSVNFYGHPVSNDAADWADFATYVSGTVGVAVVSATLLALIHTLFQQGKLIGQQDSIIKQQQIQLDQADKHQRRIEAYSRAEKFFPALLKSCQSDLDVVVTRRLEEKGWPSSRSQYVSPNAELKVFFSEQLAPPNFEDSGKLYFSSLWGAFLHKPLDLAMLVAGCIEDAEELRTYLFSEIGDYKKAIHCSLLYFHNFDRERVEWASQVLSLPLDGFLLNQLEQRWKVVGERALQIEYPA